MDICATEIHQAEREEMHRKTLERPAFKVSKEIKRPVSAVSGDTLSFGRQ